MRSSRATWHFSGAWPLTENRGLRLPVYIFCACSYAYQFAQQFEVGKSRVIGCGLKIIGMVSLAGREGRGLLDLISGLIIWRSHDVSFRFVVVIGLALPHPMVETDGA